jgi:hypothetical protein
VVTFKKEFLKQSPFCASPSPKGQVSAPICTSATPFLYVIVSTNILLMLTLHIAAIALPPFAAVCDGDAGFSQDATPSSDLDSVGTSATYATRPFPCRKHPTPRVSDLHLKHITPRSHAPRPTPAGYTHSSRITSIPHRRRVQQPESRLEERCGPRPGGKGAYAFGNICSKVTHT